MSDKENNNNVKQAVENAKIHNKTSSKQLILWVLALIVGGILGSLGFRALNEFFDFIATVFTRMFQLVAIPTIALAVITTLSSLGAQKQTKRIFFHTITYTLLTTISAALVGLILYIWIAPESIPTDIIGKGLSDVPKNLGKLSYYDHILSVIPNNFLSSFLAGNVLSVLLIATAIGFGLAFMPKTEHKEHLVSTIFGAQELLFTLIRGLIFILPVGIVAFAAQLSAQIEAGVIVGSLGKYVAVVLGGNAIQFFIVLPLFMLLRNVNPIYVFKQMSPALAVALFTKSSAGTLPVTLSCAEENLKVNKSISRFVLPICTTINMNGCAAFILVTSLFVMQNAGFELTLSTMVLWLFLSVFAAIGNAGVPMGCYFLTMSLMSSVGAPLGLLGVILPIYTIIDMIETAENVWSDSTVCAITDHDLQGKI